MVETKRRDRLEWTGDGLLNQLATAMIYCIADMACSSKEETLEQVDWNSQTIVGHRGRTTKHTHESIVTTYSVSKQQWLSARNSHGNACQDDISLVL